MKRSSAILVASFVALLAIATFLYMRSTDIAMLNPAGPIAFLERRVILITILLSGIVVIPVFGLLFYFAWKYRAGSPAAEVHHRPDWDHDSRAAEIAWWLAPSVIILVLSGVAWGSSYALDPYKPIPGEKQIEIQVVALEWKWLFIYPKEGIASINMFEVPVGIPVHFSLTAEAPMNSFWIPQLGGQIMVMPGMSTELYLRADKRGEYSGVSANLSGEGFSGMRFIARAVSEDEFLKWTAHVHASSTPLDRNSYAILAVPSSNSKTSTYTVVDANIYNEVMMNAIQP